MIPIQRDLPDFKPVFQGKELGCVPCSISYVANYLKGEEIYNWKELFNKIEIKGEGANAGQVLTFAQKLGWFTGYTRIWDRSYQNIVKLLEKQPLIIGLQVQELFWAGIKRETPLEFRNMASYGHMCVLWDLTPEGHYRVVNFAKADEQDWRILNKNYPIERIYVLSNEKEHSILGQLGRFVKEML